MKTFKLAGLSIVALSTLLAGCSPIISGAMNATVEEKDIVQKTADYFSTDPKELKITNIDKKALFTIYKTTYKGVLYNCKLHYDVVECKKPGN